MALALSAGAYAQNDSMQNKMGAPDINRHDDGFNPNRDMNNNHKTEPQDTHEAATQPDGVMMQNGKMMVVKDNRTTLLENDMTLSNGIIIMRNGSYMRKGGTKKNFKDGDHMDMSGNLISMKGSNNMYLLPDSTIKKNNDRK